MIEAVNSVLSNVTAIRALASQADSAQGNVQAAEKLEAVSEAPKAPYISPYIQVDTDTNKAVIQVRDSDTGDIINQYPSESRLQQIRSQEEAQSRVEARDVSTPSNERSETPDAEVSSQAAPQPAESQAASQTLSFASQSGTASLSAGVSVDA